MGSSQPFVVVRHGRRRKKISLTCVELKICAKATGLIQSRSESAIALSFFSVVALTEPSDTYVVSVWTQLK